MTKHPDSLIDANAVLIYVLGNRPDVAEAEKSVFDALRSGEKAALLLESVLVECVSGAIGRMCRSGGSEFTSETLPLPLTAWTGIAAASAIAKISTFIPAQRDYCLQPPH